MPVRSVVELTAFAGDDFLKATDAGTIVLDGYAVGYSVIQADTLLAGSGAFLRAAPLQQVKITATT
jgi:hypothetical protein